MREKRPSVILLAGPNGSGKTTTAPLLLKGALGVEEFVNADVIAQGLSGFRPEGAALAAGRAMLGRIRELAAQRASFAFETTLASRLLAPWIGGLVEKGYEFHLIFLWLPGADLAVSRVADRVRLGGHDVPEETIRRRYDSGLRNFFDLYQPLATTWRMYDNSGALAPRLIARGKGRRTTRVLDRATWALVTRGYVNGRRKDQGHQ
ncbi:MAG: Zeta toxin family protein [Planctomycetota bacterium]|nr:Zeta toxin family protein [Planctomycetota bacterium]